MLNALTIDVEDYHNVVARDWKGANNPPTKKVVDNTRTLLKWFSDRGVRGTFFILGEVAQTYPELIREIDSAGHELGVHGFYHRQVFKLTPGEFLKEVSDAKSLIENISGRRVLGHRAPAFSIMPHTRWALDVLCDAGFQYDSSIFPIRGRRYGWPGFQADIHEVTLEHGRKLIEAPLSTVRLFGRRWPACGGGYIRHFPRWVGRWAFSRVQRERPAILYLHPYEIELGVGEVDTTGMTSKDASRIRRMHKMQLRNRESVAPKIHDILDRNRFCPLRDVISSVLGRSLPGAAVDSATSIPQSASTVINS